MAGKQQYTSSLFVQSGSRAKFESGLEVTESIIVAGTISASGYFDLDGNEITGGGAVEEFFAGSGSGVSASNPSSIDTFVQLTPGAINTSELASSIFIHTTHSSTFSPNHYAFVKITDEFETKQSGSVSNYDVGTLEPGVYRYLVYAAQTGSGGETHQVYSTIFIKGFVNEVPVIDIPTAPTLSIAHDETTGSLILHFTNSEDPNNEDAITQFTASRQNNDPDSPTVDRAEYTLVMSHSNFSGNAVSFGEDQTLQTGSRGDTDGDGIPNNFDGLGKSTNYADTLFFTASISGYTIVDDSTFVRYQNRFDNETFTVTLRDYNDPPGQNQVAGISSDSFTLQIKAPPTASISNIKVKFENDGFTGIDSDTLTHTLLYDRTESLSSASIAELPKEYTSSLIRLSTRADIIPPTGYDPSSTVTEIKIPTQSAGNDIRFENNFKFVKFVGANGGSTASFFNTSTNFGQTYNPTESLGYTSFVFKPTNFTNNTQSIVIGARSLKNDLNKTVAIRHGNNNHYEAFSTAPNTLTFHNIPNINISDVVVEVESGSFLTNTGHPNLTSSLLYGYTSSLTSPQTQSALIALIPSGGEDADIHPQFANYISSSIVRLRVKAKITEPFGPDHKPITFTLTGSKDDNTLQFEKTFIFSTHSGADCVDSSSVYSSETKRRLVGTYTSSWQEFNFPEGVYNFTTQLASSSNAGSIISISQPTAVVSMSGYDNVLLSDLKYETEHSGLTGSGVNDANIVTSTTRQVLYGSNHIITGTTSSYHGHPSSSLYASHSLLRMRVRGKITEPFGPSTSKLKFNFISKTGGVNFNTITDAFTINTTSSNTFVNNQLVTTFTSSLIEKTIDFSNDNNLTGSGRSSDFILSGSVNFISNSTDEFIGTGNISIESPTISTVTVIDTLTSSIEEIIYETETFGHSSIPSTSTTRSVLYGDSHITNETSESADWEFHPSASTYASHSVTRFRIKAKITEPLGPLHHSSSFENKWISSSLYSSSRLDFFTGSTNIENSSSEYNSQGNLVTIYTSSYIGMVLSSSNISGINYFFTSGNILHEPVGENGSVIGLGITSSVLVKDTPKVIVTNVCEFEEYGHSASNASDSGTTNTERTVLYGDSHTTNAISGSTTWENHPNSASYASHSVSRARIRVNIIEPLGPAHYKISNIKTLDGTWETVLAFTGSTDFETSSSAYDGQDRLVTNYIESWKGRALSLDTGNYGGSEVFTLSLNTSFDSNLVALEENSPDISTTPAQITVNDTPATKIEFTPIEIETFGDSNIGISNTDINNASLISRSIRSGQNTTDISSSGINNFFTASSVSRFRTKVTITEPLGPLHHSSSIRTKFIHIDSSKNVTGPYQLFSTNSVNIFDSSSAYDGQDRLVTSYTSSFTGSALESTMPNQRYRALFRQEEDAVIHNPIGENSHDYTSTDGSSNLFFVVSKSEGSEASTKIDNVVIEVESGSFNTNEGHFNLTSSILYGFTSSLLSSVTKSLIDDVVGTSHQNYLDYISQSIVRLRVKAKITEPFGIVNNTVITKIQTSSQTPAGAFDLLPFTPPTFNFNPGGGSDYTVNEFSEVVGGELVQVSHFTSSFVEIRIPSGTYTFTASFDSQDTTEDETISSISTAEISMSSVAPTRFEDLHYEMEKHGYAGSGSNDVNMVSNTSRTVLFGDSHLIHNGTSSGDTGEYFASHASSSIYASQSVARFRVRGKMIEPFGPGTTNSTVDFNITSSGYSNLIFGTASIIPNTNGGTYNNNKELITVFTSSFESQSIQLIASDFGANNKVDFHVSGNVTHNPISLNNFIVSNPSFGTITVKDTPQVIIRRIHEFEGYGHSASNALDLGVTETTRSVLYGDPHITNATSQSTDWENHLKASVYASHSVSRARVKIEIIEPVGPAHDKISIQKSLDGVFGNIEAFTGSSDFELSSSIYDSSNRLKVSYTESWVGRSISLDSSNYGGSEVFTFGSTTTQNISGENGLDKNPINGTIIVNDTPSTIIEDIIYETETFGHSRIISTSTTRSVLYGDPHITNETSESKVWTNHPSASTYASHSVSRFRVRTKVIEPLGFLHHSSSFENKWISSSLYSSSQLDFFTGSISAEDSSSEYDGQTRLITSYTSSFMGAILSSSNQNGVNYLFTSGNILHEPVGENGFITESGVSSNMLVKDTPPTIIQDVKYETETFGHSEIVATSTTRSVLYGDPHITNDTSESKVWETHPSASTYASHSVSRFRIRAKIIQPLGYLVFTSSFEEHISSTEQGYSTSSLFNFFSGSLNVENESAYDSQDRLVTDYNTPFHGHILSSSNINGVNYLYTSGNILHEPTGENGSTISLGVSSNMLVKDTPKVIIENVHEFEGFGYSASNASDSGVESTTRTVLYGDAFITNDGTGSGDTGNSWANHPSASTYASHSVTRMRLRTKIIEPLGYAHATITFGKFLSAINLGSIQAFTGSSDFETSSSAYDGQDRLVTNYIESWKGKDVELDLANRGNGGSQEYSFVTSTGTNLLGENGLSLSGNPGILTVKNTPAAEITINKIEIGSGLASSNNAEFDNDTNTPNIVKFIPFNNSNTIGNPNNLVDELEPHSLTRFRILVDVIEPLGYAHYPTTINYEYQILNGGGGVTNGQTQTFATESTDIFNLSSEYDSQTRLISGYTSSFLGENLGASSPNFYKFIINTNDITLQDGNTEPNEDKTSESTSNLFFIVSSSQEDPLQIEDIAVEVESASLGKLTGFGSNLGHSELTSSLLFGLTSSLLSSQTQSFIGDQTVGIDSSLVEAYNSESIIRFRVKSKIIEPFGNEINSISASFKGLQFDSTQFISSVPQVPKTFELLNNGTQGTGEVEENFLVDIFHSGSLDLSSNPNFTGTRQLRLVSMSLKGDLDSAGELVTLIIGNQTIISNEADFLSDNNVFNIILPQNLQTSNPSSFVPFTPQNNNTESIQMNNGVVDISASFQGDVTHTDFPFELLCVFEYDVFSFQDAFLSQLISPAFIFGENQPPLINDNIAGEVISSSAFETGFSDGLPRIVSKYTSSWVELNIPTGSFEFISEFSSASNSTFTSSVNFTNSQSANVTMSNTLPTELVDFKYETEIHGHSDSGSNDEFIVTETTRSVLYGDTRITNATSGGVVWENHPSASTYASHSVTRFRVRGKVIEPFGPATTTQTITYQSVTSSIVTDHTFIDVNTKNPTSNPILFTTEYDSNKRRITTFTQSTFTDDIGFTINNPNKTPSLESTFKISGSVGYTINNLSNPFPGANTLNVSTPVTTSVKVLDTAATKITITKIETETFGESNVGISNNNQNTPGIISRSVFNNTTTLTTGSGTPDIFTGSVVTRFRILSDIIEPLGYLHNESQIRLMFNEFDSADNQESGFFTNDFQIFSTNSGDIFNSTSLYDGQDRLVTSYTSSFNGTSLGVSDPGYWKADKHQVIHDPSGENEHSLIITDSQLYFVVSQSFSNVTVPTVTELKVEVEQDHSGSNIFGNTRNTNVLHGMNEIETDQAINSTYNGISSGSLVIARVLAKIEEPLSTIHNSLDVFVGGFSGTQSFAFSTQSTDIFESKSIAPEGNNGLIVEYTSSFFPVSLSVSPNTNTSPLGPDNAERTTFEISASLGNLSIQQDVQPDNIIIPNLSHSFIHVTGALSSSTAITINPNNNSNNNISSSEIGLYYVHNGSTSDETIVLNPTLITTPPTFTSESNLSFPNNLDIDYSLNLSTNFIANFDGVFSNQTLTSNPSDGTASIFIESTVLNTIHSVESLTLTTTVTDTEPGNGVNSIETLIFIIPSTQPQSLDNTDSIVSFDNHGDGNLTLGVDKLYEATLPTGLGNYETSEINDRGTISNKIFITSQSNGGGNNYSMSLALSGSHFSNNNPSSVAFNFADTGSLVVKINGTKVVNYDLSSNFDPDFSGEDQNLNNYAGQGTSSFNNSITPTYNNKGRLIIDRIHPFNNVSQSITSTSPLGQITYPHGYQAFNAHIEIDEKLRNGYNKIEIEHNLFNNVTHSITPVDWYYDDGLANPVATQSKDAGIISISNFSTHSLSGISYFLSNQEITISISNIFLNLANKTYRKIGTNAFIAFAERINSSNPITINSDDNDGYDDTLNFELNNINDNNGLSISPNINTIIPNITSTGSVSNIKIKGTGDIENNNGKGELRQIKFGVYNRNYSSEDSWSKGSTFTSSIGRFVDDNFSNSTSLIEHFDKEDFRLESSSTTNSYLESITDFDSLLTGTFNSIDSIRDKGELQQQIDGNLLYPLAVNYNEYSSISDGGFDNNVILPNNPNHDNTTNFATTFPVRHYFRAFKFDLTDNSTAAAQGFTDNVDDINKFTIDITYKADSNITDQNALDEFFNFEDPNTFAINGLTNKIGLAIRLPGSITTGQANTTADPGSNWGLINNTSFNTFIPIPPTADIFPAFDAQVGSNINPATNTISIPVLLTGGFKLRFSEGAVILRVSIHNSFNGIIEKIEFKGR